MGPGGIQSCLVRRPPTRGRWIFQPRSVGSCSGPADFSITPNEKPAVVGGGPVRIEGPPSRCPRAGEPLGEEMPRKPFSHEAGGCSSCPTAAAVDLGDPARQVAVAAVKDRPCCVSWGKVVFRPPEMRSLRRDCLVRACCDQRGAAMASSLSSHVCKCRKANILFILGYSTPISRMRRTRSSSG